MSFGLFVAGQGGLGKSKVISETLTAEGIVPVLANSHITPLALYGLLHHNRSGKVMWLDDADSLYANMAILGLLRSALWGTGEGRVVTYLSSQLEGLPSSFEFDSRIDFTANTHPKRNEAFKAVLSRVDVFELTATNEEVVEVMRVMAAKGRTASARHSAPRWSSSSRRPAACATEPSTVRLGTEEGRVRLTTRTADWRNWYVRNSTNSVSPNRPCGPSTPKHTTCGAWRSPSKSTRPP
jgi:hypothetical protein